MTDVEMARDLWIGKHPNNGDYHCVFETEQRAVDHGWKDGDATTHYIRADRAADAVDGLRSLLPQIQLGPDGEGSDFLATIEAAIEDLT